MTERGVIRVEDGRVTFRLDPGASGTQRVQYVVSDSQGRTSNPATIAFFPEIAPAS